MQLHLSQGDQRIRYGHFIRQGGAYGWRIKKRLKEERKKIDDKKQRWMWGLRDRPEEETENHLALCFYAIELNLYNHRLFRS